MQLCRLVALFGPACLLACIPGLRGEDGNATGEPGGGPPPGLVGGTLRFAFDHTAETGFRDDRDERQRGHLFEVRTDYRVPLRENLLARAGLQYQRYAFSSTDRPLPENLQRVGVPVTLTFLRDRRPLFIVTVTPSVGFEDRVTTRSANVSLLAFRSFTLTETLSAQLALFGSTSAKYPVLPGAGLVWNFSETGTLRLTPPRPEIVFDPRDRWEFALGASLHGGTFRVSEKDGVPENSRLNLTEYRAGARVSHRLTDTLTAGLTAGWMIKRKFDHDRIGVVHRSRGAPYAGLSVDASF